MDWRRMPERGRVLGRRITSFSSDAAVRVRSTVGRDGQVPGLLSFIVPVYDTEKYLDECLASIRAQEYRNIEIVCVDDGTPDDSVAIVRRNRLRDPRVRLVRRPNGGLSAARNTGVAAARGEYVAFVDSDDMVPPSGYRAAVESLDRTGSDFAVLPYQRWRAGTATQPPMWVRAAHALPREAVSIDEFPDALANAIICSKVFRREFWDRLGLSFVEGIIYEDQQVSAEAYARARAFDVLTTPLYLWRHRADRSSISQGKREVSNLRAQFAAANESIEVLRRHASHAVVSERLLQLLSNDMPQFTARLVGANDAYYQLLREELPVLLEHLDREAYLAQVPPQQKVIQHLVVSDQRAAAEEFLKRGGLVLRNARTSQEDVGLVVQLPFWGDDSVDIPRECFRISERQTKVHTSVRAVRVHAPSRVTVQGWAFIENVDLAERSPQVRAFAVSSGQEDVELTVRTVVDETIDEAVLPGSSYNDHRRGGIEVDLDLAQLGSGLWQLRVDVTVDAISRSAVLGHAWPAGTAAVRHQAAAGAGRPAMISCRRNGPLEIEVYDDGVPVTSVTTSEGDLVLTGTGRPPDSLVLTTAGSDLLVKGIPERVGEGAWSVELATAELLSNRERRPGCRLVAEVAGEPRPVRLAAGRQEALDPRVVLGCSETGELTVGLHPWVAVIDDVELTEDRLVLTLSTTGAALDDEVPTFESRAGVSIGSTTSQPDGRLSVELPYRETRWGRPDQVLRPGSYDFVLVHPRNGERTLPRVGPALLDRLPLDELAGPLRCQLQLRPAHGALSVGVAPPLPVDCRGARNQVRLQALANGGRADEESVFFRTLYGEAANDSGAAVHRELLRRRPDLTLYWSVQDYSVEVPEGGVPLVEGTQEWHERLGAARYVVLNVHQPMWYRKPRGQVLVQTFHGYPYKGMGQEWWARSGLPEARITSFLDRAAEWDHLVSPATYATPRLLEAFFRPEDAARVDVIEAGYPRNDVLLTEEGERIRQRTREVLGIGKHQTAVLYAPTFRDYLSSDGMTAKAVRFFDPVRAAKALGPEYVVLVRGHAFNARAGLRTVEEERVVDVTYYPDVTDLCLASDAAILDYSSLRFDYALLRRPMVFLVPDKREYHENRPAIMPFGPTAPGPRVRTTAQAVRLLKDLEGLRDRFADDVEKFVTSYLDLEDGHAAERVVDRVFTAADGFAEDAQAGS